jgi:hypothetical protein
MDDAARYARHRAGTGARKRLRARVLDPAAANRR